jgi:hypothetical protein
MIHPWVATALRTFEPSKVGFTRFADAFAEINEIDMPDVKRAWSALRSVARSGASQIDISRLLSNLRIGVISDDLNFDPQSPLVVSTVHRSKGREFERVVIVDDLEEDLIPADLAEETRLLFVAATRPRHDLFTAPRPETRGYLRMSRTGRWVQIGWKRWQRWGFEVKVDDIDHTEPPGVSNPGGDPIGVQEYIATQVSHGDSLSLVLGGADAPSDGPTVYHLLHHDQVVGMTSESFGSALLQEIGAGASRWPTAIRELRVESIETVPGNPAASENAGLGPSGLWLGIRAVGLGVVDWSKE